MHQFANILILIQSVTGIVAQDPVPLFEDISHKLTLPYRQDWECVLDSSFNRILKTKFNVIDLPQMRQKAIGKPGEGGLCQGQVFQVKDNAIIRVYRMWSRQAPLTKWGHWWTLKKPSGSLFQYRRDYAICYHAFPIDSLVSCQLKANALVVAGPGQSAFCDNGSYYLPSAAIQVYIEDVSSAVINCRVAQKTPFLTP